jgi:hypothetical protein
MFLGWLVLVTPCTLLAPAGHSLREEAWGIRDAGLQDKSVGKRAEALAALGVAAGDAGAFKTLEAWLLDPKPEIRTAAVAPLGDMNAASSLTKTLRVFWLSRVFLPRRHRYDYR